MKIEIKKYGDYLIANEDKRVTNFIIDFIMSSLVASPFVIIAYNMTNSIIIGLLTFYFFRFVYYCVGEYYWGKTLGKLYTQSMVLDYKSLNKPTLLQIMKRNLFRFISGFSFVDDNQFPIHDSLSKTIVVEDPSIRRRPIASIKRRPIERYMSVVFFLLVGAIMFLHLLDKDVAVGTYIAVLYIDLTIDLIFMDVIKGTNESNYLEKLYISIFRACRSLLSSIRKAKK